MFSKYLSLPLSPNLIHHPLLQLSSKGHLSLLTHGSRKCATEAANTQTFHLSFWVIKFLFSVSTKRYSLSGSCWIFILSQIFKLSLLVTLSLWICFLKASQFPLHGSYEVLNGLAAHITQARLTFCLVICCGKESLKDNGYSAQSNKKRGQLFTKLLKYGIEHHCIHSNIHGRELHICWQILKMDSSEGSRIKQIPVPWLLVFYKSHLLNS